MTGATGRPRYRGAFLWGGVYLALFLVVAGSRLILMGVGAGWPPPAAFGNLLVMYCAGCAFAVPLVWIRRRLARETERPPRWPVVAWLAATPVSALGAVVGGLFGPVGVLLYGGIPLLLTLGGGLALSALRRR